MHVPTLCYWFGSSASASDGTLFSLDHKLYTSDYDSDSDFVASENQPLGLSKDFKGLGG